MLKKLSLLIIFAIFLTACSAGNAEQTAGETTPKTASAQEDRHSVLPRPETTPTELEHVHIPEYFTFTRKMATRTDEEGKELLYEQYSDAAYTGEDAERSAWVGSLLDTIETDFHHNSDNLYDYAGDFLQEFGPTAFYTNSNYQKLDITRHDEGIISLVSFSSLYSGGAHPNAVQTAYNLDMQSARILQLEDVLQEGASQQLVKLVGERIHDQFASLDETALFPEYRQTITAAFTGEHMTPYWYFRDEGMVFFFNQYELGPYAAGIIRVEFAYSELSDILREEFLPPQGDGTGGDLHRHESWSGSVIPITIELDGERLLIGVEGMVHQVQLSEIHWLDDTPIAQDLIFSAKSLCEQDVLEITGGFDDETRSFCMEFYDGTGTHKVYYLTTEGLSLNP